MDERKSEEPSESEKELIRQWLNRLADIRTGDTGNDAFGFYCWLTTNRPDLIPQVKHGDPYQRVAAIILEWQSKHPN